MYCCFKIKSLIRSLKQITHLRLASLSNLLLCFFFIPGNKNHFHTYTIIYVPKNQSVTSPHKWFFFSRVLFHCRKFFREIFDKISFFKRRGFLVTFHSESSVSLKSEKYRSNFCFKSSRDFKLVLKFNLIFLKGNYLVLERELLFFKFNNVQPQFCHESVDGIVVIDTGDILALQNQVL